MSSMQERSHVIPCQNNISKSLRTTQSFVIAGGLEGSLQDEALTVQLYTASPGQIQSYAAMPKMRTPGSGYMLYIQQV